MHFTSALQTWRLKLCFSLSQALAQARGFYDSRGRVYVCVVQLDHRRQRPGRTYFRLIFGTGSWKREKTGGCQDLIFGFPLVYVRIQTLKKPLEKLKPVRIAFALTPFLSLLACYPRALGVFGLMLGWQKR